MTGFILRHQLALVALAAFAGIAGLVLHIRGTRRAERQEAERIDTACRAFAEEIDATLSRNDGGQQ